MYTQQRAALFAGGVQVTINKEALTIIELFNFVFFLILSFYTVAKFIARHGETLKTQWLDFTDALSTTRWTSRRPQIERGYTVVENESGNCKVLYPDFSKNRSRKAS